MARRARVADKDFVVERDFPYVDETATEVRRDAQAELVPPVFTLNALVTTTPLACSTASRSPCSAS